MLILGIDPGIATTGWGVVEIQEADQHHTPRIDRVETDGKAGSNSKKLNGRVKLLEYGCILTQPKDDMPSRLLILREELKRVLNNYKPDWLIAERLFFGVNSKTAMVVGQARGIVMLAAAESKTQFYEYTGLEVKLEVAKHGRSDKKDVQIAVRRLLGVSELPKPKDQTGKEVNRFRDDAYDAVAIALCHLSKTKVLS